MLAFRRLLYPYLQRGEVEERKDNPDGDNDDKLLNNVDFVFDVDDLVAEND